MANLFEKVKLTFVDGLTKLFSEIREKNTIADLSPEYQKFAEWLRIEYVPDLSFVDSLLTVLLQSCRHHIPSFPCGR